MTEGSRVPRAADPATMRGLAASRSTTRELSEELLTHLPDLDAWVEQAADTLLALSEALEERLLDLGAASSSAAAASAHPGASR